MAAVGAALCTAGEKVAVGQLQQRCFLDGKPELFLPYFLLAGAAQLVGPLFKFGHNIVVSRMSFSMAQEVRAQLHKHVLSERPDTLLEGLRRGDALNSIVREVENFQRLVAAQSFENVVGVVVYSALLVWLLWRLGNPRLRVVSVALLGLLVAGAGLALWISVKKIGPGVREESAKLSEVTMRASRDLAAVQELRMYKFTDQRIESFGGSISTARAEGMKISYWKEVWTMSNSWRQAAQFMLIYFFVGRGVMKGSIPFWVYHSLFGLSVSFIFSAQGLLKTHMDWNNGKQIIDRINDMTSCERRATLHTLETGAKEAAASGGLYLDQVRLQRGNATILNNVTMPIGLGQLTALVGPSGGGKSSLLLAIVGYGEISRGAVRFGEGKVDAASYPDDDRRKAFAYVGQDPRVLEGHSIEENIVMGSIPKPDQELERCARLAGVWEFAEALKPDGLKTKIAQAWKPSGGQRQRIALARALYKDAPILVLDEPSRALDAESEEILGKALREEAKRGKAVLIATHSLRLESGADVVWEIREGQAWLKGVQGPSGC